MLEKALALDAGFAEARAAYGFSHWMMIEQGYSSDATLLYEAEEQLYQSTAMQMRTQRSYITGLPRLICARAARNWCLQK